MKALFCQLCDIARTLQFLTEALKPGPTRDALLALVARLDGVIDAVLDAVVRARRARTPARGETPMPIPTMAALWPWRTFDYVQKRERWLCAREQATWETLGRGRAQAVQDQERAVSRGWQKAAARHADRLRHYDRLLAIVGPLMRDHPTRTLPDACALLTLLARTRGQEL